MPTVEVLRPFHDHESGVIVHEGDTVAVTETRRGELIRSGLARDPVPVAKSAPEPANKMAPVPVNKALPMPARRGRPPKGGR